MKKIIISFLILSYFGFSSCVITTKKEEKTKGEESTEKNACDVFLEKYEDKMDEYLEIIDRYFNNPDDEEIAKQYMKLMQEALEFHSKWKELIECADDEKYVDRFEAISQQVEEKVNELGL